MNLFKDAGKSIYKYGEKIVNKTEGYAKIAKLTMDINKIEDSIKKLQTEIGEYVITQKEKGESSIKLHSKFLEETTQKIQEFKNSIDAIRNEIITTRKANIEIDQDEKETPSE